MRIFFLSLLSLAAASASTVATIDTTGLSGTTGDLVFDFTGGGGPSGNTASILDFTTDGTLGSALTTGTVTGTTLPGEVDLTVDNSSVFFSEYLTGFTYGTSISFNLDTTTNAPGALSSPDEFALYLLDSEGENSLITTSDPTFANSLLIFDIDGSQAGSPSVFSVSSPSGVSATFTPSGTSAVPEPSTAGLLAAACCLLLALRRSYRNRTLISPEI